MIQPDLILENEIWAAGNLACGVDEVGRGCLAGPVVAAAVIMPKGCSLEKRIRDSKLMTPTRRAEMFEYILETCVDFGVGLVKAGDIDKHGINPSTEKAMVLALGQLKVQPDMLLIDAIKIRGIDIRQRSIIKGDQKVYSISCASIVAKVFRDATVSGLDNLYPEYGFSGHKGYAAKSHIAAIQKHGFTPEHRRSFCTRIVAAGTT